MADGDYNHSCVNPNFINVLALKTLIIDSANVSIWSLLN